jgi:SAM-dependent methyltransferase
MSNELRNITVTILRKFPRLFFIAQIINSQLRAVRGGLQSVHDMFILKDASDLVAVDLGCGSAPSNRFNANQVFGLDLVENKENNVIKCRLGFEQLPFKDNSIDYLTAYDLLEHIPRYAELEEHNNTPFIFLMNECFRVLKKDGIFLSMTPIYPYLGAFKDPTHNNIMTSETLSLYFSNNKCNIAKHYGITCDFKVLYQRMYGEHLVAVLQK